MRGADHDRLERHTGTMTPPGERIGWNWESSPTSCAPGSRSKLTDFLCVVEYFHPGQVAYWSYASATPSVAWYGHQAGRSRPRVCRRASNGCCWINRPSAARPLNRVTDLQNAIPALDLTPEVVLQFKPIFFHSHTSLRRHGRLHAPSFPSFPCRSHRFIEAAGEASCEAQRV